MLTTNNLYCVYDKAAQEAGFVFESTNHQTAIRSILKNKIEDAEDFDLVHVGEFDHVKCELTPNIGGKKTIINIGEYLNKITQEVNE